MSQCLVVSHIEESGRKVLFRFVLMRLVARYCVDTIRLCHVAMMCLVIVKFRRKVRWRGVGLSFVARYCIVMVIARLVAMERLVMFGIVLNIVKSCSVATS